MSLDQKDPAAAKGAGGGEDREAVNRQREITKREKALTKLEAGMKKMEEGSDKYKEAKEKHDQLVSELKELGVDATAPRSKASPQAKVPAKEPVQAAPAATVAPAKAEATAVVDDVAAKKEREKAALEELTEAMRTALAAHKSVSIVDPVVCTSLVHPRVAEVAIMMEDMLLVGGNARTLATISALKDMIRSSTLMQGKFLNATAFEDLVNTNFNFLCRKRGATSGMCYVKETLKRRLVALDSDTTRTPQKKALMVLDQLEEEITVSIQSIVEERSLPYVSNTDTILVFGRTSVIELLFLSRSNDPLRCPKEIIVLDSAPLFEGRAMAFKLSEHGLNVTYGLITSCCTLIPRCTRVFIGASSVLQNGDVFSRCGTALVAVCAKSFRIPVLCFSESYKFTAEVWLGNLAQNAKLIDIKPDHMDSATSPLSRTPSALGGNSPQQLSAFKQFPAPGGQPAPTAPFAEGITSSTVNKLFQPSHVSSADSGYLYDLTPADAVDMIICEMGCLHTSAIVAAIQDRESRDVM